MKFRTLLRHNILGFITNYDINVSFSNEFNVFCRQWYDQEVQPQNMTFSPRKSLEKKFSDLSLFYSILILLQSSHLIEIIVRQNF